MQSLSRLLTLRHFFRVESIVSLYEDCATRSMGSGKASVEYALFVSTTLLVVSTPRTRWTFAVHLFLLIFSRDGSVVMAPKQASPRITYNAAHTEQHGMNLPDYTICDYELRVSLSLWPLRISNLELFFFLPRLPFPRNRLFLETGP